MYIILRAGIALIRMMIGWLLHFLPWLNLLSLDRDRLISAQRNWGLSSWSILEHRNHELTVPNTQTITTLACLQGEEF
jgi:hypothetical protein